MNRIKLFHDKIYSDESKKISSLKAELDESLANLNNVETRAKSVIGLSSEAGLAGGLAYAFCIYAILKDFHGITNVSIASIASYL